MPSGIDDTLPLRSSPPSSFFTYVQRAHELRNGAASAADEGRRTQQAFPSDPCACSVALGSDRAPYKGVPTTYRLGEQGPTTSELR